MVLMASVKKKGTDKSRISGEDHEKAYIKKVANEILADMKECNFLANEEYDIKVSKLKKLCLYVLKYVQ